MPPPHLRVMSPLPASLVSAKRALTRPALADPSDDSRYAAVVDRDPAADGRFWYSVRSTGVYCKPSCGARTPLRKNVDFHTSTADAAAAGFRPCKRCRPDEAADALHAAVITAVCSAIERAVADDAPSPTLDALAALAGYSPHHLHRLFTRALGATPRAYAASLRAARLRDQLQTSRTVSEAMHNAGYTSTSRLHAASPRLGMTARTVRRGGAAESIRFAVGQTSLGTILVAATARGVCAIQFGDDPEALVHGLEDRFPKATLIGDDDQFATTVAQVVALVESPTTTLPLPLDIRGTAFQERVWAALTKITPGTTASYSEIAQAIGEPRATRAVAQACGANCLAVAIPCHRVVRASGDLAGYRWGVERKAALLSREGSRS
jgi:AraC family transcriptional regulator, regulatory protein of adaptative response / methylated-DNA-[protein]-cysteine methyltransferase